MRKVSTRLALLAAVASAVTGASIAYGAIVDESRGYIFVCVNDNRGVMQAYDPATEACTPGRETSVSLATVNGFARVADAEQLDGIDSTGFYAAGSKVADSDKLDSLNSTDFLRVQTYRVTSDSPGTGETVHQAPCDAGDRLVSGGYVLADPGTFITGSIPSFTSESWLVVWENDATPDSIRVFALCANQ